MKIAILTDSGSNLKLETMKQYKNLFIVPLIITIDNKSYRDQIEISSSEIYEKLDTHDIKTSLPNMSDVDEKIKEIKEAGFTDVIVINISSGLSGTFNAIRLHLEKETELNIHMYDSKTLAAGQGLLVEEALELINQNKTVEEIIAALDEQRYTNSLAMYTINTLKYLKKGGRIGKVEGTIGDVLNIKPIITVDEKGVYQTLSKTFGLKRALINMKNFLEDKFQNLKIDLTIHYGNDLEKAKELADRLMKALNIRNLKITELTPVLGIHTGPDMFAYIGRLVKE